MERLAAIIEGLGRAYMAPREVKSTMTGSYGCTARVTRYMDSSNCGEGAGGQQPYL